MLPTVVISNVVKDRQKACSIVDWEFDCRRTAVSRSSGNQSQTVEEKQDHVGYITPGRRKSKTLFTIDELRSKSLETVFSIAICRQSGDKGQ